MQIAPNDWIIPCATIGSLPPKKWFEIEMSKRTKLFQFRKKKKNIMYKTYLHSNYILFYILLRRHLELEFRIDEINKNIFDP